MGNCCFATPPNTNQPPQQPPLQPPQQPPVQPPPQHPVQPPPQPSEQPSEQPPVQPPQQPQTEKSEVTSDGFDDLPFKVFHIAELKNATMNFTTDVVISENEVQSSNVVYRGLLRNNLVAVKRFKNSPLDNRYFFRREAKAVGMLKHKRLVKLKGYCCKDDEMLLVAEFMPNDNLAQRLFNTEKDQIMEWSMRLRVAYHIAVALDYCNTARPDPYRNLSAYSVLFDKDDEACLSSFGLVRALIRDNHIGGIVHPDNVTYRFGTILLNLLTGIQIPLNDAANMINGKDVTELIDPNLNGKFSIEEATAVLTLASQCLQCTETRSHNTKVLVATLDDLNTKSQVPSSETTNQGDVGASSSHQPQDPSSEMPETTEQEEEASSSN